MKQETNMTSLANLGPEMKVVPHPTKPGFWTIRVKDERGFSIYGEYDRRELAVAVMLTT
jgi:hypothetical protein